MSELKPLYSVEETLRIQTTKLNQQLNKLLEQNTQIIELTAERDSALAQNAELAAQNKELGRLLKASEKQTEQLTLIALGEINLRDRDAEVGRAGFLACSQWINDEDDGRHTVTEASDEYAEKVRRGEA